MFVIQLTALHESGIFRMKKSTNFHLLAKSKDYESNGQFLVDNNFRYELKVWARDGNGGDVNQTLTVTITAA